MAVLYFDITGPTLGTVYASKNNADPIEQGSTAIRNNDSFISVSSSDKVYIGCTTNNYLVDWHLEGIGETYLQNQAEGGYVTGITDTATLCVTFVEKTSNYCWRNNTWVTTIIEDEMQRSVINENGNNACYIEDRVQIPPDCSGGTMYIWTDSEPNYDGAAVYEGDVAFAIPEDSDDYDFHVWVEDEGQGYLAAVSGSSYDDDSGDYSTGTDDYEDSAEIPLTPGETYTIVYMSDGGGGGSPRDGAYYTISLDYNDEPEPYTWNYNISTERYKFINADHKTYYVSPASVITIPSGYTGTVELWSSTETNYDGICLCNNVTMPTSGARPSNISNKYSTESYTSGVYTSGASAGTTTGYQKIQNIPTGTYKIIYVSDSGGNSGGDYVEYKLTLVNNSSVSVTGVSLNKSSASLTVGTTTTLTATISPSNATNRDVTWSTSNSSVATVSSGTVTAVGAGTATITVTTVDGNHTASCTIHVEGSVSTDNVWYTASDGSGRRIYKNTAGTTYLIASEAITVDLGYTGEVDFWSDTENNYDGICLSKANASLPVKSTTGNITSAVGTYLYDSSSYLSGSHKYISGTSSTKTISAIPPGTYYVFYRSDQSGQSGDNEVSYKFTQNPDEPDNPVPENANIWYTNTTNGRREYWNYEHLTSIITPDTVTIPSGKVGSITLYATDTDTTWDGIFLSKKDATIPSSRSTGTLNVAFSSYLYSSTSYVTGTGNVTISNIPAGTYYVVYSSDESNHGTTDTVGYSLTVSDALVSVTSVSLNKSTLTLGIGATETLLATVSPSNASNKSVTWSTSNSSVATVTTGGMVSGIAEGNAIITVTTADGGKTATCSVTVTNAPTNTWYTRSDGKREFVNATRARGIVPSDHFVVPDGYHATVEMWSSTKSNYDGIGLSGDDQTPPSTYTNSRAETFYTAMGTYLYDPTTSYTTGIYGTGASAGTTTGYQKIENIPPGNYCVFYRSDYRQSSGGDDTVYYLLTLIWEERWSVETYTHTYDGTRFVSDYDVITIPSGKYGFITLHTNTVANKEGIAIFSTSSAGSSITSFSTWKNNAIVYLSGVDNVKTFSGLPSGTYYVRYACDANITVTSDHWVMYEVDAGYPGTIQILTDGNGSVSMAYITDYMEYNEPVGHPETDLDWVTNDDPDDTFVFLDFPEHAKILVKTTPNPGYQFSQNDEPDCMMDLPAECPCGESIWTIGDGNMFDAVFTRYINLKTKVSSTWKDVKSFYVKENGTWQQKTLNDKNVRSLSRVISWAGVTNQDGALVYTTSTTAPMIHTGVSFDPGTKLQFRYSFLSDHATTATNTHFFPLSLGYRDFDLDGISDRYVGPWCNEANLMGAMYNMDRHTYENSYANYELGFGSSDFEYYNGSLGNVVDVEFGQGYVRNLYTNSFSYDVDFTHNGEIILFPLAESPYIAVYGLKIFDSNGNITHNFVPRQNSGVTLYDYVTGNTVRPTSSTGLSISVGETADFDFGDSVDYLIKGN